MSRAYFISFLFLISCLHEDYEEKFVAQYGNRSFYEFVNMLVFFRGLDEHGNKIYFLHRLKSTCEVAYIITIEKDSNRILSINDKLLKKACSEFPLLDLKGTQRLFDEFLEIKVNSLMVDQDSIVHIELYQSSKYKLVKLPDFKFEKQLSNFKKLNSHWYKITK